ncbi:MAG: porin [Chitinophagales bacterium]
MKGFCMCLLCLLCIRASFCQDTDSVKRSNKKYKPELSGFIQAHYLNEFNTNGDTLRDPDGFRILRVRLEVKGDVNKYVGYDVSIDPRAPEQGGILRDAFLVLHLLKDQDIRVGQQKTGFGWENSISSTKLYTVNRAEMSDAVSRGENLRDIGIGITGHIKLNDTWRIEDAVTLTNGTKFNVTGPYDFNTKKALWGRLGMRYKNEALQMRCGASFGYGGLRYLNDSLYNPNDDVYVDFWRIGADLEIEHDWFFLAGEWGMGEDMAADTLFDDPIGYQIELAAKTKWNCGPLVRYDVFQDEWKVWTFGAYYGKPKDPFRVLINYIARGNIIDQPGGHDDRLYIQMQVAF